MKKLIFLLVSMIFLGCTLTQPKLTPEQIKAEIEEIIKIIGEKPDWLKEKETCTSEVVPNFEKEVLYLAEGCENSPNKCFEKCKKEDGNACYSLALLIQKQTEIENESSNPLFLRSCKLGIISGCTNLAANNLDFESSDKETAKCVANTFEKTCQMNDSWGCSMFGTILAQGFGREQNWEEAIKYLDKACKKSGLKDEACQGAMTVKKQIEEFKKKNLKK